MQDHQTAQTSPDLSPAKTNGRNPAQLLRHARQERERKAQRRKENRPIVQKSKARGCALCPAKGADVQHHHRIGREKKSEVANLVTRSSQALRREIEKCVLLCPRCHREHHGVEFLVRVGGAS